MDVGEAALRDGRSYLGMVEDCDYQRSSLGREKIGSKYGIE